MTKAEALKMALDFLRSRFDGTTGQSIAFNEDEFIQIAEKIYKYANS